MSTFFTLHPVAPFRLDYTVFALRRRSKNNVDLWDGQRYTRLLVIDNVPVKVVIEQKKDLMSLNCCSLYRANVTSYLQTESLMNWRCSWD